MFFHKDTDMDETPKSRSKENGTAKEKTEKKEEESKKVEEVPDNQKRVCIFQEILQRFFLRFRFWNDRHFMAYICQVISLVFIIIHLSS